MTTDNKENDWDSEIYGIFIIEKFQSISKIFQLKKVEDSRVLKQTWGYPKSVKNWKSLNYNAPQKNAMLNALNSTTFCM